MNPSPSHPLSMQAMEVLHISRNEHETKVSRTLELCLVAGSQQARFRRSDDRESETPGSRGERMVRRVLVEQKAHQRRLP